MLMFYTSRWVFFFSSKGFLVIVIFWTKAEGRRLIKKCIQIQKDLTKLNFYIVGEKKELNNNVKYKDPGGDPPERYHQSSILTRKEAWELRIEFPDW